MRLATLLIGTALLVACAEVREPVPVMDSSQKFDLICINEDTVTLVMREREHLTVQDRGLYVGAKANDPSEYYVQREGEKCIIEDSHPNPLGERV